MLTTTSIFFHQFPCLKCINDDEEQIQTLYFLPAIFWVASCRHWDAILLPAPFLMKSAMLIAQSHHSRLLLQPPGGRQREERRTPSLHRCDCTSFIPPSKRTLDVFGGLRPYSGCCRSIAAAWRLWLEKEERRIPALE